MTFNQIKPHSLQLIIELIFWFPVSKYVNKMGQLSYL